MREKSFGRGQDPFGSLLAIKLDRRQEKRVRTNLSGTLVFGHGCDIRIDCTICDISPGGARVLVKEGIEIPESVYLVNFRDSLAFEAVVRWRCKDGFHGLMFRATHDLSSTTNTDELKVLRQCCIDGPPIALQPLPANLNGPNAPSKDPPASRTLVRAVAQYKSTMASALASERSARNAFTADQAQLAADQATLQNLIQTDAPQIQIAAVQETLRGDQARLIADREVLAAAHAQIKAAQSVLAQAANKALTAAAFAKINNVLGID
jgi:hypothetical protein